MKQYQHLHIYKKTYLLLLLSIILSSALVGIAAYKISSSILSDKIRNSYKNTSQFVADTVSEQLRQIQQLSDYIFFDNAVKDLLARHDKTSYTYIKLQEQIEEQLKSYLYFSSYGTVRTIQLYNQSGMSMSLSLTSPITGYNQDAIEEALNKCINLKDTKMRIENLNTKYLSKRDSRQAVYTIIRPVTDNYFTKTIGGMFISISPDLFSNIDSLYGEDENIHIYLLNDKNEPMNRVPTKHDLFLLNQIDLTENEATESTYQDSTVFFYALPNTGWKVVSIFSTDELLRGNQTILYTTIVSFLLSLLCTSLLSRFLFLRIFHPLNVLQDTVHKIQQGNTHIRVPVLTSDEIGVLSESFNYMLDQLENLRLRELQEQKQLQDAQYQALQASINPHFLYNTLNTIRWMAIIQKTENIKTVVESLTRLLRSTLKQDATSHNIGLELHTLEDYLFIQQLAYSQHFLIQWELDETVNSCPCIPFILQPLAENAIFHGLMPKSSAGIIKITSRKINWYGHPTVEIKIWDNGKGISNEQLQTILKSDTVNKNSLNGIGIKNVHERLILTYGNYFGLQISSEIGRYTSVIVHIPFEDLTQNEEVLS